MKQFKDLNFKLAVIQQLMYVQEVLKPKFDAREFAENYKEREINIDKEGYEIIPEIKKYFEDLEIPRELLLKVTELCQDGGDDIHHQLIWWWDGEDETFHIQSADDCDLVPNLEKVTLFAYYDYQTQTWDKTIPNAFITRGIEVYES